MNLEQTLQHLTGKTLVTLDKHKRFDVLVVGPKQILLFLHSSQKERKVRWEEIEPAWALLQRPGQLTRVAIHANFQNAIRPMWRRCWPPYPAFPIAWPLIHRTSGRLLRCITAGK